MNRRSKDRRRNNGRLPIVGHVFNVPGTMESCRLPIVGHVFNVPGTMESSPTYFWLSPKQTVHARHDRLLPVAQVGPMVCAESSPG